MTNLHPSYNYTFDVEAKFDYGLWSDIADGSTAFIAMPEDGKRDTITFTLGVSY